jgi:hypothetical protein
MPGSDLRPDLDPIFAAFGVTVAATVRVSGEDPVTTTVIWLSAPTEDRPNDGRLVRREIPYLLAVRRDEVTWLPQGALIDAPELAGGDVKTWRVEGFDEVEPEIWTVFVRDVTEST